ncbi:SH2 domain-containing protein 4A [Stegostoma tigrinum]|uniref:SH2 domain-containing protein 4A n=1 Tax=Stegostoma tigrinum TaxID=3053191 RepID=UPI00202B851A|nr:SH2 domain-containing protein 4A [Stegostoma tigrinum]XP_048399280.1 SH2 domain-containing protein 4A [Stegostoma tigrinum]XP_048399289.1 SH2 domain-containing protein 4A [Stegostoma tigrinum]XP_048399300.1 SH2 domain-containing protein 4A [Stegostoma tigrinum]XP_048399309.1 SH2 domain-containing protein 4A [Stegostoma tigrinum]XP_048399317.1 SH2 domain-containing protein 4A [Stegostoma tigrinum]XP_059509310.1 SH2 domain-containing protein 4A [Stegostoma tigrinum]XP_059509422.1 SH2 domain
MLQQILETMYIEPELLAELNEEQKQILFFKMRQEQIRRWKEREAKLEPKEKTISKKNGKSVSWLLAADNDVWVWVMGEGPGDKPYDQICDEIIAERARQQAHKEAGELRKVKEKELIRRFSTSLRLENKGISRQKEAEKKAEMDQATKVAAEQERIQMELKQKEEEERRRQEEEIKRLEEERTQQLYINLKEAQEMVQRNEKEDPEWRESLRKSKAADERRRSIAKQARADYKRHSLKAIERGKVSAMTQNFQNTQPPVRPPVPLRKNAVNRKECNVRRDAQTQKSSENSHERIIRWFREQQIPLRAGYERDSDVIAPWFHGVITRQETEELLGKKGAGAFLIRVSERIIGYCLSYRSSDGFKHFLIDSSKDSYTFFGVDQLQHAMLADLVEYHKEEPITLAGAELLLEACGQCREPPDYAHLFN